eukprot:10349556-Alexandrium_andersonii.AAC.1
MTLLRAVGILPGTARGSFGRFRALPAAVGRLRATSGEPRNCLKAIEGARKRPKSARNCPEQLRA